jgi:amidophosphoribosyltransferase
MRPACPPLIYSCEFLNFSTTRSTLNLAGRKMIHELGRKADCHLEAYADPDSEENLAMVECIRRRLRLTTFKHQRLDDLVTAIGLPREKLWTHCRDGSSYF